MTTTTTTTKITTTTSQMKKQFGPEKVKNAVLSVTAAVFAITFAAVSGGNDSIDEQQVETTAVTSLFPAQPSVIPITDPQAQAQSDPAPPSMAFSASTNQITPAAPATQTTQPTVTRRQVVIPFPRARTRAS